MSKSAPNESVCLLCGSPELSICYRGDGMRSVTSDAKPWHYPAITYFCLQCGHLQKLRSAAFRRGIDSVYFNYDIYHLSNGLEQIIFQNGAQVPSTRSLQLTQRLEEAFHLPDRGALLDVGCANGAFLTAFGKRFPNWRLFGFEQNRHYEKRVLDLPNVDGFFSSSLESINRKFDLISLSHVLEHVDDPVHFLGLIRPLLKEDGLLLIQVPNILENPLDMVVIDHYSHFSPWVLKRFMIWLAFEPVFIATDWVRKEITFGARLLNEGEQIDLPPQIDIRLLSDFFTKCADWLSKLVRAGDSQDVGSRVGIFGTAVAGTWLGANLSERVHFFVDEDVSRIGKLHLGKPVLHPRQVEPTDSVLLAFPYRLAAQIRDRISKSYPGKYLLPPSMPEATDCGILDQHPSDVSSREFFG